MKKLLLCLFLAALTLTLQGCELGLAAGAGAAGGNVAGDTRNMDTMADDQKISYAAERQIAANNQLANQAHIAVTTFNHVVLLTGQAPTTGLRDQAVQIVKGIPNVRRIFNEVTIQPPVSPLRMSKDAAVTTNVKARMVATTNLQSSKIKVVTENGTVYLMGLTTPKQASIAANVARESSGVQRVVKLIEYVYIPSENNG